MSTITSTMTPIDSHSNYLKIISIIAHNVKGPIKYMQYITDYTLQNWGELNPDDLKECAQAINDSARRINEQLVDIMNWARVQDGSFNPAKRRFEISKSIKRELKLLKPILRMKNISLSKEFEKNLHISSDENIFHLAFHNIITNAIKFTGRGGEITVESKSYKHQVAISIQDSGVGMSEEELALLDDDKAFSNPGTVEEQGTGFGLRIAKELIVLLSGSIEIESKKDVGTKVTLLLPD